MELFMPSKQEWEAMQTNITSMAADMEQFKALLEKNNLSGEHFPEYIDIVTAAKYLKCPISRIKSMIYVQKLLQIYHIDLTTTVYVSKKEIDELRFRVLAIRRSEKK